MFRWTTPLALLVLAGCSGTSDKGSDTDTGDTADDLPTGCVVVDGGRGYATITDALSRAADGSTITVCAGTWEEAVVIDRSVTLEGGEGVILSGPANMTPLTISAADVTVRGLTVVSTRSAIALDSADNARLENVSVTEAGSWGLTSIASSGVVVADSGFAGTPAGGADVQGGSVTFERVTIDSVDMFGVQGSDADLTLVDTVIDGVTMTTDDVSDGIGINLSGGTLSVTGGSIANAGGVGLWVDGGVVSLTDVSLTDNVYLGIFAVADGFTMDGVTTSGGALNGAYVLAPEASVSASSFVGDPVTSCRETYEEWGTNGNPWCGGLLLAADAMTLVDVSASGWNNYGIYLQPYAADMASATVTGGTLSDVGGWALAMDAVEAVVSGTTVTATREPELADPCGGFTYLDWTSAAVRTRNSAVALDGVTLDANVGFGIMNLLGSLDVSNSTFSSNNCSALFDYGSATTVTGNTFTGGGAYGGIWAYQDVITIDGNTFVDNHRVASNTYEYLFESYAIGDGATASYQPVFGFWNGAPGWRDNSRMTVTIGRRTYDEGSDWNGVDSDADGYFDTIEFVTAPEADKNITFTYTWPYTYEYGNAAQDILAYEPGEMIVTNNSFTNGDSGIYSNGGSVQAIGNTWNGYEGTLFFIYYGSESDPPLFAENTADDIGGSVVYTAYGAVEVEDVTVGTLRSTTTSGASYYDGDLNYSYEYTNYSTAFYAYGYDGSPAGLSMSNVSVETVPYSFVDATDAALDIEDVYVGSAGMTYGGGGVYADWSYFAAELEIEGLEVGQVSGAAVFLSNGQEEVGYATIDGLEVGTASGGVSATGFHTFDLRDASFDNISGDAVAVEAVYSFYDYALGTYRTVNFATAATLEGVEVAYASADALRFEGGSLTATDVVVTSAGSDGIDVSGATSVSLSGVSLAGVGGVGIRLADSFSAYDYATYTYATFDGDTVAVLDGVDVTDASSDGISVSGGSITVSGSTSTSASGNGLLLSSTSATITGNAFTSNDGYGMVCASTILATCSTNDLGGNLLGTHNGCDDACGY